MTEEEFKILKDVIDAAEIFKYLAMRFDSELYEQMLLARDAERALDKAKIYVRNL